MWAVISSTFLRTASRSSASVARCSSVIGNLSFTFCSFELVAIDVQTSTRSRSHTELLRRKSNRKHAVSGTGIDRAGISGIDRQRADRDTCQPGVHRIPIGPAIRASEYPGAAPRVDGAGILRINRHGGDRVWQPATDPAPTCSPIRGL